MAVVEEDDDGAGDVGGGGCVVGGHGVGEGWGWPVAVGKEMWSWPSEGVGDARNNGCVVLFSVVGLSV